MSVRALLVLLLAFLFSGVSVAQAGVPVDFEIDVEFEPADYVKDSPLPAIHWEAHNFIVSEFDDDGKMNQKAECGGQSWLGTAWYKPPTDTRWVQGELEVECKVDLKSVDLADPVNAGACFRSAAIVIYRGGSLVTARVFVMRIYDETEETHKLKQYLEVIVRKSDPSLSPPPSRLEFGTLVFAGKLTLKMKTDGEVQATYPSASSTLVSNTIGTDTGITHVGIQIRRPANGLASPTIDDFESPEGLESQ